MQNSANAYKIIGSKGLKEIADEYHVHDDIDFIQKLASPNESILDLGCGYGRITLALAKAGYSKLVGVDISPNLISDANKEAETEGLSLQLDVGDMRDLPYSDSVFEKVFCMWNSFNEILSEDDQLKVISEIYRVLQTGGEAFVILFNGEENFVKEITNNDPPIVVKKFKGVEIQHFIHTRPSLAKLIAKSKFKKFSIDHIKMHQKTRILVHFIK